MALPKGCYGRFVGRSGLAKLSNVAHGGTIDSDYHGYVCMVLFNLSNREYDG